MTESGCNDPSKSKCWKLFRATLIKPFNLLSSFVIGAQGKFHISHQLNRNEIIVFTVKRFKFSFLSVSVNKMNISETATKYENETLM